MCLQCLSQFLRKLMLARQDSTRSSAASPTLPTSLPPPPAKLLASREQYEQTKNPWHPIPETADSPLSALYRLYKHTILDQNLEMRNELESFWYHTSWAVEDIPDPHDPDPERYAVLACITALLVTSFNHRIDLGLPRDAPPIITYEMLDEFRQRPKAFEQEPFWASQVPILKETLKIPHWDPDQKHFTTLEDFSSGNASEECKKKNVLIWQPHIFFT